jgi:hypothetical protein
MGEKSARARERERRREREKERERERKRGPMHAQGANRAKRDDVGTNQNGKSNF